MLLERWHRIESLFHEALAKPAEERASFLDEVCSTDRALRCEVESWLLNEGRATSFLESSGSDTKPSLPSDRAMPADEQVGPYTVKRLHPSTVKRGQNSQVQDIFSLLS